MNTIEQELRKIADGMSADYQYTKEAMRRAANHIAELEKDKARLQGFIWESLVGEPCEEFEPECVACQANKLLKETNYAAMTKGE